MSRWRKQTRGAPESEGLWVGMGEQLPTHVDDEANRDLATRLGEAQKFSPASGVNRAPYPAAVAAQANETGQHALMLQFVHQVGYYARMLAELGQRCSASKEVVLLAIDEYEIAKARQRRLDGRADLAARPIARRQPQVRLISGLVLALLGLAELYMTAPRFASIGVTDESIVPPLPITRQMVAAAGLLVGLFVLAHDLSRRSRRDEDAEPGTWREQLAMSLLGRRVALVGVLSLILAATTIGGSYLTQKADAAAEGWTGGAAFILLGIGLVIAARSVSQLGYNELGAQEAASAPVLEAAEEHFTEAHDHYRSEVAEQHKAVVDLKNLFPLALEGLAALASDGNRQVAEIPLYIWLAHPEVEEEELFPFEWPQCTVAGIEKEIRSYLLRPAETSMFPHYEPVDTTEVDQRLRRLRERDTERIERLYAWEATDFEELSPGPRAGADQLAVPTAAGSRAGRAGAVSKRLRLVELLETMPDALSRPAQELADHLAHVVGLHVRTARRYIAEWQAQQGPDAGVA